MAHSNTLFKFFIASRYMNRQNGKKINIIFLFLFLGLALGLAVMLVVLGIMNGFQDNHISRRIEIGSFHINISRRDMNVIDKADVERIKQQLYSIENVAAVVPYIDKEIVFRADRKYLNEPMVLKLRGLDLTEIRKDSRWCEYLKMKSGVYPDEPYSIMIGEPLSERLAMGITNFLMLTPDISLASYKSSGVPFQISGIFRTESYDYDRYWGYISIDSMIPLCGNADPADIGVKLTKPNQKKLTLQQIHNILGEGWILQTAEDINKGYFAALKLEKVMIVFLFMIIFLMVSINTFGALKLMLAEKKKDISILKALGTTPDDITTIYTIESIVIGFIGCMIGVILGYFIAFNIANIFHVVEFVINAVLGYIQYLLEYVMPGIYFPNVVIYDTSIYYQTSFIIKLDFWETLFISFIVVVMTIISAFVPVYHSSKLKPNEVLKS